MKIERLITEQLPDAKSLLQKNNLPIEDINANTHLFGTYDGDTLVGMAGVELYGNHALVRSVCVEETYRSKGMAELLTAQIENYAKQNGADSLYLLTTTAENYFKRKGFIKTDRNEIPQAIMQTSEFSTVCPSSATVMMKNLLP